MNAFRLALAALLLIACGESQPPSALDATQGAPRAIEGRSDADLAARVELAASLATNYALTVERTAAAAEDMTDEQRGVQQHLLESNLASIADFAELDPPILCGPARQLRRDSRVLDGAASLTFAGIGLAMTPKVTAQLERIERLCPGAVVAAER